MPQGEINTSHFPEDIRELEEGIIIQFGVPPHRVDFINRIDGVGFAEARRSCEHVVMVGKDRRTRFRIIGLEALIANKRASGRPKDLDDLRYLDRKSRSKRNRRS